MPTTEDSLLRSIKKEWQSPKLTWKAKKPLYIKKDDDRYSKHVAQLKKYGFSDTETWAFYSVASHFIIPRLIRFREIANGHPFGLTPEEWNAMLDEMIFAFDWAVNDEEDKYDHLTEKERAEHWKRYDKGMQLFAKWFRHLWW